MRKLALAFALLILAIPCQARVITVDDDGPADFNNIQAAIDDANAGDIIEVQPGTYTGQGNRNIDFLGKAITVRSTDPNDPNIVASTVIDCNGTYSNQGRGFYFHSGEGPDSVIDGLTIINGYAPLKWFGGSKRYYGGGIFCDDSSPTIQNCTISTSTARDDGGGIYCNRSSPTILNCMIKNCTATQKGGGICCKNGSNCIITNCTFEDNIAEQGGGICCDYRSNAVISNCAIRSNMAEGSSCGLGGGIHSDHSDPIVSNCIIEHNRTDCYGAGIYSIGYDIVGPTFKNCTIRFNRGCDGGGIHSGKATFNNCLITGNSVSWWGGGALCYGGDVTFCNCTISGNFAGRSGAGIMCSLGSKANITNCILWNNFIAGLPHSPIVVKYGGSAEVTFSNVQFGWPGEGNIDSEPQFAFFDDYSFYNDFHLVKNSPCIDAGTNTPDGELPTTDLDGTPRPLDGDANGLALADMGAYEYNAQAPRIAISSDTFDFAGPSGGPNPPNQTLLLRNAGGGTLFWQIEYEHTWLQANPTKGISDGEIRQIDLGVDTTALSPGEHSKALLISDAQATNSPLRVSVTLTAGQRRHVPSEYPNIQSAIDACNKKGDGVIIAPGRYSGEGNRDLKINEKTVIVSSICPNDPCIVAETIIDCEGTEVANHWGFHIRTDYYDKVLLDGLRILKGYWDRGSGISCYGEGSTTIRRCVLERNIGSAIFAISRRVSICDCKIINNSAMRGAGIFCADAEIKRCYIHRNYAQLVGGGVACYYTRGCPIIKNSVISGNSAGLYGGGIFAYGGGIYALLNTPLMTNLTITGNHANSFGGGIACYRGVDATLSNCILNGNIAENGKQIALTKPNSGASKNNIAIDYCNIQGGENEIYVDANCFINWGHGNMDSDPCFVEPGYWADVNDPNIIVEPNDSNAMWIEGDYHLLDGSPCIDAGDPNYVAWPNETDLDGNQRIANGVIDMGVYEIQVAEPAELILDLADDVMALNLHKGITNGLEAKLNAALGALEDENENNDAAAVNTLGAFINAVEAQRGKKIPQAEADALIAAAQEIIDLLSDG